MRGGRLVEQLGEQPPYPPIDLVHDRADLVDRLACRIVQLPVEVSLPG